MLFDMVCYEKRLQSLSASISPWKSQPLGFKMYYGSLINLLAMGLWKKSCKLGVYHQL